MARSSMIFPESFTPPDCGATAGSRPPPRVLLDLDAYLADRRNATTATATSRLGHTIQVSLYAADPPAMSYLCAHCPCSKPDDPAFAFEPRVVGVEGRFVLLSVRFAHSDDDEYFMYKADTHSPSLELLRRPPTHHRPPLFNHLAVVPLGDGGHYLLAARSLAHFKAPSKYELHIYSSADQTWSIKPLPDDGAHRILPDKVIRLGDGGVVGWVDLRVGVAVCDLLREPLDVRFIPLPEPMPANRGTLEEFHPGDPAWRFRDVAFSSNGGVLKFVEVEHRWIVTTIDPPPPTDPSEKAVHLDSDLIMSRKRKKKVDTKPKTVRKRDGWRMVTWSRPAAMSSDRWQKERVIDVDDIVVDDTVASSLRSEVGDEHGDDERYKFRNMYSAFPTLSTDDDDLVYLKTKAKVNDSKAWMVAVDLGKKTLTSLGAYPFAETRHDPCVYNYSLCALSNYLNMDPDSSQSTKLKDSADPLKTQQSSAEEASCPCTDKPRHPLRCLMLELEAQEDHRSIREHGADLSNEECSNASSGPLPPPASHRNCLPPRPVIKQSDGAGDRTPNPADVVIPVNNDVVARPTGSSLLPQVVPQLDLGNHPNAHAFNHPNAHAVNHHHHHLHDATGLVSRSCPPPPQPVPQHNMSHWNRVSYQNHPWPPPPPHQQYYVAQLQAQQWNGAVAAAGYQEQRQYTNGVNNQNHWNWNEAAGYYYSPSANVNLHNPWGHVGYGHYSAPNLPASGMLHPAGQFPNQPGVLPQPEQTANQQLGGAPEQCPAGSAGDSDAAQAWTPRKRWRGAGVDM